MKGEHMFYCNRKKALSYQKKGIAAKHKDNPNVFKLLFEPKGKGVPKQTPRDNKCLVCGTDDNLTRHHVIPYSFRKLMTSELKDHRSEEVVPLCEDHHREYETSSRELSLKLLSNCQTELVNRALAIKATKASHTLRNFYDHLSEEKKAEYKSLLKYTNLEILSDTQIIMNKYGQAKVAALWKNDFRTWLAKKGIKNFKFKK